jgi:hypothetical protein
MHTSLRIVLCGALLLGCSSNDRPGSPAPGGAGGTTATGGSGGSPTAGTGGSATGGSGGTGGTAGTPAPVGTGGAPAPEPDAAPPAPQPDGAVATPDPASGTAPYGCTGCKRLFDGKTLNGFDTAPGAWVVKEGGVLASTGKAADIYTHDDLGDYRIFFQVRHLPAMGGKDHQACTVLFGKRPADPTAPARSLGGAQFQPPNGYSWDYGIGGTFSSPAGKPKMDASKWSQCEIVVKEAGSFKAACCSVGDAPCKTAEVLSWKGPGRKHPFDFMMHNAGLFDEYREIWIELNPTDDGYLSQK